MITIVTKSTCPFCSAAKEFLDSLGKQYCEVEVSRDSETYEKYKTISGMRTVPQIFIWEATRENLVGWYDDMMAKYNAWEIFQ